LPVGHRVLAAVTGHRRDQSICLWGRDFTLGYIPCKGCGVRSPGEAGEQRLRWLRAALGGERNLKLPKLRVGGGGARSVCQERERRAGG